jgi:hypothetical protein
MSNYIKFNICLMILGVFFLFRNSWVYRQRSKLLDSDRDKYYQLPPYDDMVIRFWIWDVNKFLK